MKLEYTILWIDNELESYIEDDSVKSIENFLSERGFEPIIEQVTDEAQIDQFIDKHDYDLIISDYNLNITNGDVLIKEIRDKKKSDSEILFYTGQTQYSNIEEVKKNLAFIDRLMFHVGRENLMERIEKSIELTIKKLLQLNATRGLITAATSELDVEIHELVMQLIDKKKINNDILKGYIESKVFEPMKERISTFWNKGDNFQIHFQKMDAVKKWEILRDILKPLKSDPQISSFLRANKTYQDEIITIRNKFAHAKAEEKNGKQILKGHFADEDFEFDKDKCIQIRRNLIQHKKNIENLKQFLQAS
jgi:CheY-like chemotaxis protein